MALMFPAPPRVVSAGIGRRWKVRRQGISSQPISMPAASAVRGCGGERHSRECPPHGSLLAQRLLGGFSPFCGSGGLFLSFRDGRVHPCSRGSVLVALPVEQALSGPLSRHAGHCGRGCGRGQFYDGDNCDQYRECHLGLLAPCQDALDFRPNGSGRVSPAGAACRARLRVWTRPSGAHPAQGLVARPRQSCDSLEPPPPALGLRLPQRRVAGLPAQPEVVVHLGAGVSVHLRHVEMSPVWDISTYSMSLRTSFIFLCTPLSLSLSPVLFPPHYTGGPAPRSLARRGLTRPGFRRAQLRVSRLSPVFRC